MVLKIETFRISKLPCGYFTSKCFKLGRVTNIIHFDISVFQTNKQTNKLKLKINNLSCTT